MLTINYRTSLTMLTTKEVRKLANESQNIEAKIELLLRFFSSHVTPDIERSEVSAIAYLGHKLDHNNPIFNYALGTFSCFTQPNVASRHLRQALKQGSEIVGVEAACGLVDCYRKRYANTAQPELGYLKAAAWAIKAITLGSSRALDAYLEGVLIHIPSVQSHQEWREFKIFANALCLLGLVCLGKQIDFLEYSGLFNQLEINDKLCFKNINDEKNVLTVLSDVYSPVRSSIQKVVAKNPSNFFFFIHYSFKQGIFTGDIYSKLMQFFIWTMKDVCALNTEKNKMMDNAIYQLFLYYLNQNDLQNAENYLVKISDDFQDYKVIDLNFLNDNDQSYMAKVIFTKLFQAKHYDDAFKFLSAIKNPEYIDQYVMSIFTHKPEYHVNYEVLKLKKELLGKLVANQHKINDANFSKIIHYEYRLFTDPLHWANYSLSCIRNLFETFSAQLEQTNRSQPFVAFFFSLIHQNRRKQELNWINKVEILLDVPPFINIQMTERYLDNLSSLLKEGEIFLHPAKTDVIFEIEHIISETKNILAQYKWSTLSANIDAMLKAQKKRETKESTATGQFHPEQSAYPQVAAASDDFADKIVNKVSPKLVYTKSSSEDKPRNADAVLFLGTTQSIASTARQKLTHKEEKFSRRYSH